MKTMYEYSPEREQSVLDNMQVVYENSPVRFMIYVLLSWALCFAVSWKCGEDGYFGKAYLRLAGHRKVLWHSFTLSCVHTCFALVVAVSTFKYGEHWATGDVCRGYLPWMHMALLVSIGYFVSDIILLVLGTDRGRSIQVGFVYHHILVIVSFFFVISYSYTSWFVCILFFNELSVIFNNIRWFMQETNQTENYFYIANGICFAVTFFACRVLFIPLVFYVYMGYHNSCTGTEVPLVLNLMATLNFPTLWILNLSWFYKIMKGVYKVLGPRRQKL